MITKEDLQKVRSKAATIKAMVIGDTMLDKYIYGIVERISPEAPVPILRHQNTEVKAGGAANVALNLASWGCHTSIIGVIGNDSNGETLKSILDQQKITHYLYISNGRPTTIKTRVVAASHHLLRIDEESSEYLVGDEAKVVLESIHDSLLKENPDLIILEDYNKGFLTEEIISYVIQYGHDHNVFIAVDPKERNFMNFKGADLFKPNLREACHAARMNLMEADLPGLTLGWLRQLQFGTIAITLGGQGVFLQNQHGVEYIRPARTIDVVDVCGAGDAVICSLALGQISGLSLEKSGALANLTGAYVCSHSGVVPFDPQSVEEWI